MEHRDLRILIAGDASRTATDGLAYPHRWARDAVTGGDRLEFLGAVGDEELATLMRRALVVVVPSRYESFGLVVVEAMMHGRAVVASDIGGMAEIVSDGETGALVSVDDADSLARSIGTLLADPERAVAMGRAGRRVYESRFSIDVAAERLEALLGSWVSEARLMRHGVL
jgi:glycosyltransferase involved in cell wall biosynthesis